ncbi:MAG: DNA translocase FtsK [Eubacteriales bacterium]|nr:DNA translocase FtsK [Eubacteriales bacterium]
MAKGKKSAPQYESGTLAAFAVAGILLITVGVVTLLAVVGGLKGAFFSQVKQMMQGLGGGLCIGVSVLMIWGGLLVAFSTGRSMPKRGFLLITLLFLAVLGMLDLLSKVGQYGLMEYLVNMNNAATPPVADAAGYWSLIRAGFDVCKTSGAFGGALGILLAWPAWTFLGTTFGAVALGLVCVICVLLVSRFDLLQMVESIREGSRARGERRRQERAQQEYQQQLERQRQQAEEDDRRLFSPAFRRKKEQQHAQEQQPQPQAAYPPYGSMLMQQPPMEQGYPAYGTPVYPPQGQQQEIYDEIIPPEGWQLPWRKNEKKPKKEKKEPYQTRMTFTPSEMGVAAEEAPLNDTLIMSASKRKAMDRIEEIRKRKAEINDELVGNEMAQLADGFAPAVQAAAAMQPVEMVQPVAPQGAVQPLVEKTTPVQEPKSIPEPPAAPQALQQQADDRHAAYKRPAGAPKPAQAASTERTRMPYTYPSIDLLNGQQRRAVVDTRATDTEDATRLEKTLESFGIPARVQRVTHGPAVTRFELGLVSSGINVKRIMGIADNIALDMAANGGVRIEIPIPGTNLFGVEVPNKEIQSVTLAEVLLSQEMQAAKSPLAVALGRDIAGKPVICDIAKMPHLLIAGQTGSGKSVCINAIINSILFRSSPEEVRMIMIDPKVVELQCYNVVPHLLIPVVSDPHKAAGALQWAVAEMLDRYHKMQSKNVRELSAYNAKLGPGEEKLPRIVIIIDELADLMLACKKEVEESIIRIAQLARAAGIHMVVATQRPTVDVITGLIKANIPSRIAFAVSSSIDSRTILDQNGAEKLLGRGDMFYFPTGASAPIRVQGCFLSDAETERVVGYIGQHSHVDFDPNVIEAMENDEQSVNPLNEPEGDDGVDDRLAEAIEMVVSDGQASISMLQRRMKIGYARAGRLIDDMAARGIVSKSAGSKPREVLMTREEYDRIKDTLL